MTMAKSGAHDGAAIDGTRGWRMLYLNPVLVAGKLTDRGED